MRKVSFPMHVCSIAFLVFALAFSSAALAQEGDGEESSAPSRDSAARARFEAGLALYEDARYEEALIEFEGAWDLSHRPEMLFNIANAAERSFDHARAASALEEYLVLVPDADNEAALQRRIERNRNAAPSAERPSVEPDAVVQETESGGGVRLAGWLTLGGAAAIGVVSLATGLVSRGTHSDLEDSCSPTCPADRAGDIESGQRMARVSTALSGIALAAAIAGVVLVIVGGDDGEPDESASTEVALLPSLGGASVRVRY